MNESIDNRIGSNRRVALGIGFVYAGLCLAVLSVIWGALVPVIIVRRPDFAARLVPIVSYVFIGTIVLSIVCDVVGRLLCLLVSHREIGIAFYVVIVLAVAFDLTGLTVGGLMFWHLFDRSAPRIEALESYVLPLGLVGHALFQIFLIRMTRQVERPLLTTLASVAIVSWGAVVGVLVYYNSLEFAEKVQINLAFDNPKLWAFGFVSFVALISYGLTLSHLRIALKNWKPIADTTEPSPFVE